MAEARPSTPPVLATYGLTRNFGGLVAVRDVSIVLRQGELHAVIGPNGAGKTTLVNMLSGEIRPTAGRIELMGRDVAGAPSWRMTGLGVGRSFQRTNIFASLTVLENVRLAVQAVSASARHLLREVSRETVLIERAERALQHVGLADAAPRVAGVLSHGEQRQLEIAMALASGPKVLLLDEPLAGMGPEESQRMTALLKGLAREHALLLIEHDMDFVFAVADWMTVMAEGTVLAEGRPEAIRANTAVQDAYLGGHV
ncbi:MAG: ABC transporter ATP-binding protein [Alphaproteobacteria bacterium]|jgi:branched-chain amino acid transport system ATP-binding protein|nr:MAG: ABC transporter ATP-binding protein [Alphaproteobacteria bacterium]